jgi:glycosyltransferase involved in cell wall biosynthesis
MDVPVVVVDDGSPGEEASRIAARFGHRVVRNAGRTGIANARNSGINAIDCEWVLNLDGDDVADPTLLTSLYAEASRARRRVGIVYTRARVIGEGNGSFQGARRLPFWRLKDTNFIPANSLFRRAAWETVGGFDGKADPREDWEFWLAIVCAGWRPRMIERELWGYRRHGGNHSDLARRDDWIRAALYVRSKHQEFVDRRHHLHPRVAAWWAGAQVRHLVRHSSAYGSSLGDRGRRPTSRPPDKAVAEDA